MKKLLASIALLASVLFAADYYSAGNFKWLVGTAGPWRDSMVPAAGFKVGATAPAWGNFTDANIQVLRFAKASDDLVHGSIQINHDYREGSEISAHIHVWYPTAAIATASSNVWQLTYSWGIIGGTFPTSTVLIVTNSGAITQNEHRVIEFPHIAGTAKTISSIFAVTVERTGADDYDVYDDVIGFLGCDVHYQVDSLGSMTDTTK